MELRTNLREHLPPDLPGLYVPACLTYKWHRELNKYEFSPFKFPFLSYKPGQEGKSDWPTHNAVSELQHNSKHDV